MIDKIQQILGDKAGYLLEALECGTPLPLSSVTKRRQAAALPSPSGGDIR